MDTREIAAEYRLSHWAKIMQERQESGSSIKAYCQGMGIHENVYYYWQRKLRAAACAELLPSIEQRAGNKVVPQGWAVCEESPATVVASGMVIEIGKSRVHVGSEVSLEQLETVCRVLLRLC